MRIKDWQKTEQTNTCMVMTHISEIFMQYHKKMSVRIHRAKQELQFKIIQHH